MQAFAFLREQESKISNGCSGMLQHLIDQVEKPRGRHHCSYRRLEDLWMPELPVLLFRGGRSLHSTVLNCRTSAYVV